MAALVMFIKVAGMNLILDIPHSNSTQLFVPLKCYKDLFQDSFFISFIIGFISLFIYPLYLMLAI